MGRITSSSFLIFMILISSFVQVKTETSIPSITTTTNKTRTSATQSSSTATTTTETTTSTTPSTTTMTSTTPSTTTSTVTTELNLRETCNGGVDACNVANASCLPESGDNQTCQCNEGFYEPTDKNSCKPKLNLREQCYGEVDACNVANASCLPESGDNQTCQCNEGFYEPTDENSCKPKLELGIECDTNITANICKDPNSTCQPTSDNKTTCQCNADYDNNGGPTCIQRPKLPENSTLNIFFYTDKLTVVWNDIVFSDSSYNVLVRITPNNKENNDTFRSKKGNGSAIVDNLESGTFYCAEIKVELNNIESKTYYKICKYTSPELPDISSLNIFYDTDKFTVKWNDSVFTNSSYNVLIRITPNNTKNKDTFRSIEGEGSTTVDHLKSGTFYYAEIKVELNHTESETAHNIYNYTKPVKLSEKEIHIEDITEDSMKLVINQQDGKNCTKYKLLITPKPKKGNATKDFTCSNEKIYTHIFSNLKAATLYTISTTVEAGEWVNNLTPSLTHYTKPYPANITIIEQYETTVVINAFSSSNFSQLFVKSDDLKYIATVVIENDTGELTNLTIGTLYNMTFRTQIGEQTSTNATIKDIFTTPGSPQNVRFSPENLKENHFFVSWDAPENQNADKYCLILENKTTIVQNWTCTSDSNTNYTFTNLSGGELYTVYVKTMWKGIYSMGNASNDITTRPPPPTKNSIIISDIGTNTFKVVVTGKLWDKYQFDIQFSNTIIETVNFTKQPVHIDKLMAGTNYTIIVHSFVGETKSEFSTSISTFTKPGKVNEIAAHSENSSALYVTWKKPSTGEAHAYEVLTSCKSPNRDTNATFNKTEQTTSTILSNLDPGTFCTVTITTLINNTDHRETLRSMPFEQYLVNGTKESAPGESEFVIQASDSNSVYFTWNRPPNPNGIIRKYMTVVIDEYNNCIVAKRYYVLESYDQQDSCDGEEFKESTMCGNSTPCPSINNSVLEQNTSNLHAYRNYSVKVQAFTKCWGSVSTETVQTNISVPSTSPKINSSVLSNSSIVLTWDTLNEMEEGNGPITAYTIRYTYKNRNCPENDSADVANVANETTAYEGNTTLSNLWPYWNYSITISASTEAGEGNWSQAITYRTNESNPGRIDEIEIKNVTNTSDVQLNWSPPCLLNGIITIYEVKIKSKDVNNPLIVWNVSDTSDFKGNLKPYSNYSMKVRAFTSAGPGEESTERNFTTKVGVPKQPRWVNTTSDIFSTLSVTWTPPEQYTGPTNYTVTAIDVESPFNKTVFETGYDFNASSCTINGLYAYWNYTVKVTATTDAGKNDSNEVIGTTAQSEPGNVAKFKLEPELDVTKPRTLKVEWDPPTKMDLHGIITAYFITFTSIYELDHSTRTNPNVHSYIWRDIKPGSYTVQIFAATIIGNGSVVLNEVFVQPGAPLKLVNETESSLLMQPSTNKVSDDEKQIAVKLPLRQFLCNDRNGKPKQWGVIVSQDSEATDDAFSGTLVDFEKKKKDTYKSWFNVKDMDTIPPYIATSTDWRAKCINVNRRKRAAITPSQENEDFIVGLEGKCSGNTNDIYCNGELQPGRSYRVKSFVCTDGGCTETEYSKPISTVHRNIKNIKLLT